ncbi:MAG TPA: hypothetical protein VMZ04_10035 [Anaerolineae bacterium]|nr:hypothetical protein [Anaerolineae bacterium]
MEQKVIDIDTLRPHVSIKVKTGGSVVCPVAMFQDVVDGKLLITDIECIDEFAPTIIKQWMEACFEDS